MSSVCGYGLKSYKLKCVFAHGESIEQSSLDIERNRTFSKFGISDFVLKDEFLRE